jgi:signal transduction histidine kinase
MRHRASAIGATLYLTTSIGGGTDVVVEISVVR